MMAKIINYKFCPQCKSELNLEGEHPKCDRCGITLYENSSPCAGVLPVKDGKVLLAKRAIEPHLGAWDVIGGFLGYGEHPETGAVREAKEETGLDIKLIKLLGIYTDKYGDDGEPTLNIHYIGEVIGGELKAQDDVASLHWVPIEEASGRGGFKNTRESLEDLKKWFKKGKKKAKMLYIEQAEKHR